MKLLLADDDTDLLDVTAYALRRAGYVVVTVTDGQEAVDRHRDERPDLVLLDLALPRLTGFEACRRIRERATTPVILLTARTDDDSVVQGFAAGADDYVAKPFSHRQLAVRAVLDRARGGLISEPAGELVVGDLRIDAQAHEVTIRGARVRLTPTEFRLLHILAINAGRTVGSSRLVEHAWGYDRGETGLLKTHVSHLRRKLGLGTGRAERPGDVRIRTVPWVGYALSYTPGHPA
jgi:DNA-binding response OmpR family regulator